MGNASSTPDVPTPPAFWDDEVLNCADERRQDPAEVARFKQQAWMRETARLKQQEAVRMNFDDYIEETNAYVDRL